MSSTINITLELGGGVELITSTPRQKKHAISLPSTSAPCPPTFSLSSSSTAQNGAASSAIKEAKITAPPDSTQPSLHVNGDGTSSAEGEGGGAAGEKRPTTMRHLLHHLLDHLVVERREMLVDVDTVRPGILVLINDADWELEGELEYEVQDGDQICFISTLHGG